MKIVSTEWLAQNMDNDNLVILDCQPNVHDYFVQHIPGAVFLNESTLRVPDGSLPAQYVPADVIEQLLRRIGVDSNDTVVVYTGEGAFTESGNGLEQTMMAYTLDRFGHDNVMLLDGGLEKWMAEGRDTSQKFAENVQKSDYNATVRDYYFVDMDWVKRMKDRDDVILLDARPPAVYEGQGPWIKPGHIPGAVSVPWVSFFTDDNHRQFKPMDEIQTVLDANDITPDKTIICSCGTGREATAEFVLFNNYLGYPNVKIYEGSFTEWSSYPDNPTVTGPNPN